MIQGCGHALGNTAELSALLLPPGLLVPKKLAIELHPFLSYEKQRRSCLSFSTTKLEASPVGFFCSTVVEGSSLISAGSTGHTGGWSKLVDLSCCYASF